MNRIEIFEAIKAERARQDEKHPVAFSCLLNPFTDPTKEQFSKASQTTKEVNDLQESLNKHSACGLVTEELYEFFAETDKSRQVDEAIQNAALWVRIIEGITK